MGRGIISGAFWGLLVSALGLGAASVVAPPPERPGLPAATGPQGAPGSGSAETGPARAGGETGTATTGTETDAAVGVTETAAAPTGTEAGGATTGAETDGATTGAETGGATTGAETGGATTGAETGGATTGAEVALAEPEPLTVPAVDAGGAAGQGGAARAPAAPAPDAAAPLPEADTDPAGRPATQGIETAFGAPEPGEGPDLRASAEEPVYPNPQALAPQVPAREEEVTLSTDPAPGASAGAAPPAAALTTPPADEEGEARPAYADPAQDLLPAMPAEPVAPALDDVAGAAGGSDAPPQVAFEAPVMVAPTAEQNLALAPAGPRPPEAGATAVPAGAASQAAPGETAPDGTAGGTAGMQQAATGPGAAEEAALRRHAASHDAPDGLPRMAVILIDEGRTAGLAAGLRDLPFPVSVALDPAGPEARAAMEAHRAAGTEVFALVEAGATVEDLRAALEMLPQSVGVLARGPLAPGAAAALAAGGHGLVRVQGPAAEVAGLPQDRIARDLDSGGEDRAAVVAALGTAAEAAGSAEGLVLLGRVRPDTLAALAGWGAETGGAGLAIVPASAVLLEE